MNSMKEDNYALFEKEVKKQFSFLQEQYKFRLKQVKQVENSVKVIRYESSLIYVSLYFGPPEFEPQISFGRIGIDDMFGAYSFSLGDLVRLKGCKNWQWENNYPNHITCLVSEYARLLKYCGSACLKGDHDVFQEMKARRDNEVRAWQEGERANRVRNDAEAAWKNKEYNTVVYLYETIYEILTELEKKKLDYARKQHS